MTFVPISPAYVPKTLGELADHFAGMATYAPKYERFYNPDGDPADEFAATRKGLANVRSKLGERAYEYLLARVDENWQRLQTGDPMDLRNLKLSFSEMIHFLRTRRYRSENFTEEWAEYTGVR